MPLRPRNLLDLVPLALAGVIGWMVAVTWAGRIGHPYDLEWMEGGMLVHAWRLAHGLPLYPEPGPDWVPYIYPPGYSSLVATLGQVFGLDYVVGRGVSIAGTLAAAASVVFIVGRHTKAWGVAIASAFVFLGCYESSGSFYDLVRPDGLLIGLVGWSVALGMERRRGAAEAAGLLLCAAFLVKHNAAAFGFAMALGIWAREGWRGALRFGLAAAVPALAMVLALQISSDGNFYTYIVEVPRAHPLVWERFVPGAVGELGKILPVAAVVAAAWLVVRGRALVPEVPEGPMIALPTSAAVVAAWAGVSLFEPVTGINAPPAPQAAMIFGALAAASVGAVLAAGGAIWQRRLSWRWVYGVGVAITAIFLTGLMRAHHGGFLNVLIPAHWVLSVAFGVALGRIRQAAPGWGTATFTAVLLSAQLGYQIQELDLDRLIPTDADRAAGDKIVAILQDYDEPFLSPVSPWLAVQAGKAPSWHLIAVWDINHKGGPFKKQISTIFKAAREHHWAAVVEGNQKIGYGFNNAYQVDKVIQPAGKGVMAPKTGWRSRPRRLLVPKGTAKR